jgi:hypothetical protein
VLEVEDKGDFSDNPLALEGFPGKTKQSKFCLFQCFAIVLKTFEKLQGFSAN